MKKRIVLLTTLAAMLAAAMALSGVAQAKPIANSVDAKCAKLAIQTLGSSFNPGTYTFIGGTEGPNDFTGQGTTEGNDVFCGFGGMDSIPYLDAGDIFLGGAGDDGVGQNSGTFYGEAGNDFVSGNFGTFYGGAGNDHVNTNSPTGTFDGGDGTDSVSFNDGGILISVP
jgi:hypothetical protein